MNTNLPILVIMGPTASGKSAIAMKAAERFSGEIISADSMQLYREMDIGTAKPAPDERRKIPHHLIDLYDISERTDLYTCRTLAEEAIKDIRSRGKLPILCGGTGLYLRAVLYGLDNLPAERLLRDRLDAEFDSPAGFEKLKRIMADEDPADFEAWKNHCRKLIRAREVFLLTGKSVTELRKTWPKAVQRPDAVSFVLDWQKEDLQKRIALRCREMLSSGWIEETEKLMKKGLFESPTAWQVIGYAQIRDYLAGKLSKEELEEAIIIATRQFARRQRTWFRTQHKEAQHIAMPCSDGKILKLFQKFIQGDVL